MKGLATKQEHRLEKKKKKITALAQIMRLNDKERNSRKVSDIDGNILTNAISDKNLINDNTKEIYEKSNFKRVKLSNDRDNKIEILVNDVVIDGGNKIDDDVSYDSCYEMDENLAGANNISTLQFDNQNDPETLLTTSEYNCLRKEIYSKRSNRNPPKFRLKEFGECAKLTVAAEQRTPIFLTDIEHLLMTVLNGSGDSPCSPTRWCSIEKVHKIPHSVVLIVEGLSLFHYFSYQSEFIETNKIFSEQLEVLLPPNCNDGKILEEFSNIPLTHSKKDALIEKYGSLECAIDMQKDPMLMIKPVFSITDNQIYDNNNMKGQRIPIDRFPRTKLLLSALQMVDEGYPLPLRGELQNKYLSYKFTKDQYDKVHDKSPLFGVDCEMCRTSLGINELTRISIVNESYETVYETLVRPTNQIIDYLTKYSGITADLMMNVTKTLIEVQQDVSNLLPTDAILVGQSLNSDLHAMQMMHPYIIDTSVIFNITGDRRRKSKLQFLAKTFLGEIIQNKMNGHDPVEDSLASMKLTKLKLSKGLDFGDAILEGRKQQNYLIKKQKKSNQTQNLFSCASKNDKTTAIVAAQEISKDIRNKIEGNFKLNCGDNSQNATKNSIKYFQMDGNKLAIKKTTDVVLENALNICNINVAPQQLELSRIQKSITNVDKWISKLYEHAAYHGLFVVLFGGTPGTTSGVAMMKIKMTP